jgi:hypothetical protein
LTPIVDCCTATPSICKSAPGAPDGAVTSGQFSPGQTPKVKVDYELLSFPVGVSSGVSSRTRSLEGFSRRGFVSNWATPRSSRARRSPNVIAKSTEHRATLDRQRSRRRGVGEKHSRGRASSTRPNTLARLATALPRDRHDCTAEITNVDLSDTVAHHEIAKTMTQIRGIQ